MGQGRPRFEGQWNKQDSYQREYEMRPRRPAYRRPRKKRSIWPVLLGGCAIGILLTVVAAVIVVFGFFGVFHTAQGPGGLIGFGQTNGAQFTHTDTQSVPLSTLTQLLVCNKIGNVSIAVDPNAQTATVTTQKIVHAQDSAAADQEFKNISVEVQPPGPITQALTCVRQQANAASTLIVNTTIPQRDGFLPDSADAVDVTITLPPKVLPSDSGQMALDVEAPLGNVEVNGLSGVFHIMGSSGNVTVTHATLSDGSHIETGTGNVTFDGALAIPTDPTAHPHYIIQSEKGNIGVTLPSNITIILDANTNIGTIHSEFPINVDNSQQSVNFRGPLNPSTGTSPTALLTLNVSTGNVEIHRAT